MSVIKIFCGFSEIVRATEYFRKSSWDKGKSLYDAKHLDQVSETRDANNIKISGRCLSQVKTSVRYNVNINLTDDRTILNSHCDCVAGIEGKCKHAAAVIWFINNHNDESVTSTQCTWNLPKRVKEYSQGSLISSLFPPKLNNSCVTTKPVSVLLSGFSDIDCPLIRILKAENGEKSEAAFEVDNSTSDDFENPNLKLITEILNLPSNQELTNAFDINQLSLELQNVYLNEIKTNVDEIIKIAARTKSQSQVNEWHRIREVRISSTKAHDIRTRTNDFLNLAIRLLNNSFKGNVDTSYGNRMEIVGLKKYTTKTNTKVINTGVVISKTHPWLCCSPDGLCQSKNDDESIEWKLIEIKSPSSRKNENIIDSVNSISYVPYIIFANGKFELKTNHRYYTQIQVSLFVLNLKTCDLVVHSSKDTQIFKSK